MLEPGMVVSVYTKHDEVHSGRIQTITHGMVVLGIGSRFRMIPVQDIKYFEVARKEVRT